MTLRIRPVQVLCRQFSTDRREFILSVLKSTATKREAKNYISKYTPRYESQDYSDAPLRIALMKIRDVHSFPDSQSIRIGNTISRLVQLGVSPLIIIDAGNERAEFVNLDVQPFRHYAKAITAKAGMMADAIERAHVRPRLMNDILEAGPNIQLGSLEVVLAPMKRGVVPIISPLAYDSRTGQDKLVDADDVIISMAKTLNDSEFAVEKVIFIDPLGGLPSEERRGTSHVYVNLKQEFDSIKQELSAGSANDIHMSNLIAMDKVLKILPDATGIITTPHAAAASPSSSKNPLIYNVLTDRPVISPSLPVQAKGTPTLDTTILRNGMPVNIIKSKGRQGIDLVKEAKVGRIDINRLENLINDSFGKTIDMAHYLKRVNGKIAGIIVAGDYDGGAIVTWEQDPHDKFAEPVLYLDKFAVARSAQGSSGVADVVFKALLTDLFPDRDLLWRSRANNPVNKWYFERSRGCLKLGEWVMFWCGSMCDSRHLAMYQNVCLSIKSSFKSN